MTEATEAAPSEQAPVTVVTTGGNENMSVTQAARALAQARHKPKEQSEGGEQRQEATQPTEPESTSQEDDAAAAETQPPGETESADPAEVPPIEPPRSWTKEDKELFAGLPRETQERLAERERSRDTDFSRRQNEAADKLKGLTAKEQAVEQARQQYESALPILLQNLQAAHAGEFADVKTMQDLQNMAANDWPRYIRWDAAQKQIAAVQQESIGAQQRQQQERIDKFVEFAKKEDDLLIQRSPELVDPAKMAEAQKSAVATLKALGFDETELGPAWVGQKDLSLRDHRVQLLIRDASLWRDAQAKARTVIAKPLPPAQRPSAGQSAGTPGEQQIQNLTAQLEHSSGIGALRAAAKLVAMRRAAR